MICTADDDEIKEEEMSRACSTYGKEVHAGFWWGNLRERNHLKDLDVNGRIIILKTLGWSH